MSITNGILYCAIGSLIGYLIPSVFYSHCMFNIPFVKREEMCIELGFMTGLIGFFYGSIEA